MKNQILLVESKHDTINDHFITEYSQEIDKEGFRHIDLEHMKTLDENFLENIVLTADEAFRVFYIQRDDVIIGSFVGDVIDDYYYCHRIYILPEHRVHFHSVIQAIKDMAQDAGCVGLIMIPDTRTAKIYNKHNIAKELKI